MERSNMMVVNKKIAKRNFYRCYKYKRQQDLAIKST